MTSAKTSGLEMGILFGAYGTFVTFFGLAQLPASSADFTGIVDCASAFVLELVTNSTAKPPPRPGRRVGAFPVQQRQLRAVGAGATGVPATWAGGDDAAADGVRGGDGHDFAGGYGGLVPGLKEQHAGLCGDRR